MLLSRALKAAPEADRIDGQISPDSNYFLNDHTLRTLRQLYRGSKEDTGELHALLKLTIEEGMDSGKLWGIQCDYRLFFDLRCCEIFSEAIFIFLYSNNIDCKEETAKYEEEILAFLEARASDAVLLSDQQIFDLPSLVFDLLSAESLSEYRLTNTSKVQRHQLVHQSFNDTLADNNTLVHNNLWIRGGELTVALLCPGEISKRRLEQKLSSILSTVAALPFLYVFTDNAINTAIIELGLKQSGWTKDKFQIVVNLENPGKAINLLLEECESDFIIVDNLLTDYNLATVLVPVLKSASSNITSAALTRASENAMGAVDLLTMQWIPDNVCLRKTTWRKIGGFDERVDYAALIWEFSIKATAQTGQRITLVAGQVNSDPQTTVPIAAIDLLTRNAVINQYKHLVQQSLDEMLTTLAEKEDLPFQQIKTLQYQIGSMQALLTHSKDELKALTDLSANLKRRIQTLENRWFYKLGRELKRLKAIFFKKKTPGTSTLKRILAFFRFAFSKPGLRIVRKVVKGGLQKVYLLAEDRPVRIVYLDNLGSPDHIYTYHDWICSKLDPEKLQTEFEEKIEKLSFQPKISIIMPVYNPPVKLLKEAIESVIAQDYQNWELCIADDCSPNPKVRKLLHYYEVKGNNIKVCYRTENGHISASSNSALALATGEFVLLMDHDDLLTPNCLSEVVLHLNEHPKQDILYSDEDKIDEAGQHSMPHFKPDWAPDSLMSRNYFGHVVVIRKTIMDEIGGFRLGVEGSQDYDLLLRATERSQNIGHISKVLYHWRIHKHSAAQSEDVKPYAYIAAKKALEEALVRRNTPGSVHYLSGLRGYRINYQMEAQPKVSIIIPTKDQTGLLKNAIDSILEKTDWENYEILVLNNNSSSKEYFAFAGAYAQKYSDKIRFIDANFPFNFSKLMNLGVHETDGEFILFLNNDIEVIHADWLRQMVSYSQQKHVGAVGVKLLYPDDTVQHAGVIVGLGGVAGHVFVQFPRDEAGYFNYLQSVNNFSAVTAACMMCRREVYEEVQGMNEDLEVEYNDVDLCLRFTHAGYFNLYLPTVELYHYESATRGHPHQSRESFERHIREMEIFKSKWQHVIERDPYYNPNLNLGVHDYSLNFSA